MRIKGVVATTGIFVIGVPLAFLTVIVGTAEYERFRYSPEELQHQLIDGQKRLEEHRKEAYCAAQAEKAMRDFEDQAEARGFSLWDNAVSTGAKNVQSGALKICRTDLGLN